MSARKPNPRRRNGSRRDALRRRVASMGMPCHICGKPIDYSLPPGHPMSFELDEIVPVSRYYLGGYASKTAAALDRDNVAPAHRVCNQRRGNRMPTDATARSTKALSLPLSSDW